MRKKLVAGNWKMHKDWNEAMTLLAELVDVESKSSWEDVDVMIAPPFPYMRHFKEFVSNARSAITVGAQTCASAQQGAFTGEVSAPMIHSLGCSHVIIGHSERRQFFGDTDEEIEKKIHLALEAGLVAILCVGEHLEDREAGNEEQVVQGQIKAALRGTNAAGLRNVIIAYEPVWAIGTGKTASPAQAQAMHAFIRSIIQELFDAASAAAMRILYGGSVKPNNATELFSQIDIDGGLIGGASLKVDDFKAIIEA